MIWVIAFLAGVLAAVAAAGVAYPFRKTARPPGPMGAADPLEEERVSVLRSLRELEDERDAGTVTEEAYRALRSESEARAVAVLRAVEHRTAAVERSSLPEGDGRQPAAGRRRRPAVGALVAVALAAALLPVVWTATRERAPGEPITGTAAADPLALFEDRVRRHPQDLAARLDLGERYLAAGRVEDAVEQYLAALSIDPGSAEARAQLGLVLLRAGRPEAGLRAVDRALEIDPDFPLALYYRGVILLELDRPAAAAEALRAYLDAAPFGSLRQDARRLLERARTVT